MPEHLFGTDGIRGVAGTPPLDAATITRVGASLIRALRPGAPSPRVLLGRDTRESGGWIEQAFARGASSTGARCESTGVIPTPGVAYLTRARGYDVGVMISASHNPYRDNGIKVFSSEGEKISARLEAEIATAVDDGSWAVTPEATADLASVSLVGEYATALRSGWETPAFATPLRIAVDCANGATSVMAGAVLGANGNTVSTLHASPDGRNINEGCGSTHPESLAAFVRQGGYDLGAAFDGDGDRVILVDHRGHVVDGDALMLICAKDMKARELLPGDAVVATVMSNIGLEIALRAEGIELIRCPVGDKHVMEELAARNLALGGEQSGHVIFRDYLSTGDGQYTALSVLAVMARRRSSLAVLADEMTIYPQVLHNVRVRDRRSLDGVPEVAAVVESVRQTLAGRGRLLVRYSGTEPLLRVMIEGPDLNEIERLARSVTDVVRARLGCQGEHDA